ncbi:MAG: 3-hydroxyacyl-ACP dehydratase FabZ [Bdellovibrionaceae bacterium]|nr:3-hydroxyacyl-ACP dehydratase FabZ [Pseudobdellovibrionaceae bacterium]
MSESKPYLNVLDIWKRIPHRYPFLLIDRVDTFENGPDPKTRVGRKVVARKNITVNEQYFQGHFPHMPIMPGVLQVEAIAQAGALACVVGEDENLDVRIARIESARFRRPVVPGDTLEIHAEITKEKAGILALKGAAYVDKELATEVEIIAKVFSRSEG